MSRVSKDKYYLDVAEIISERSTCLKRQYGAVIVKDDEIIATGYNGSPRGEINCCDIGNCKRMNVPSNSGNYADCHSVHAEMNAVISASRREMIGSTIYLWGREYVPVNSGSGYWNALISPEPCPICKRLIKNAGIRKVVTLSGEVEV